MCTASKEACKKYESSLTYKRKLRATSKNELKCPGRQWTDLVKKKPIGNVESLMISYDRRKVDNRQIW